MLTSSYLVHCELEAPYISSARAKIQANNEMNSHGSKFPDENGRKGKLGLYSQRKTDAKDTSRT